MSSPSLSSLLLAAAAAAAVGARPQPAVHAAATAAGSVSGTITYTGTPPKMRPIDMAKEPYCVKQHASAPVTTENVVTGPNNTLEYVVVYVSAGGQAAGTSTQAVRYDQKGCQYLPHVAVMQVGEPLEIYNDDPVAHNIHPLSKTNPEWNRSQPPGAPAIKTSYAKAEFIPVKCNVHPWMHGYFVVLPTAHSATSDKDGKYEITGLAPGAYTLTAWHERFGTQTKQVTVPASGAATADFVFKALPY